MRKCANISPYMRRPLVIYDFATAPLWITLYMRKSRFSFLSVRLFVRKNTNNMHKTALQRQNTEISKQIFPEKEYRGLSPCRDPSRQFFLWITTTSNKFENWSSWKLEILKFVNTEGEVIKQGLLCALSAFPLNKTRDTRVQRF